MVDTNSMDWKIIRDNVSTKNLSEEDVNITLMKLEPNIKFDEHTHAETEWVYIIEGSYSDHIDTYSKGHFVKNSKGSRHLPTSGPEGCTVLVVKLI